MKDFKFVTLLDIYGDALTAKQKDMLADYYERDYSLSEIGDNCGISRQAVHSAIKQAEESLCDFEKKFGICAFVSALSKKIDEAESECDGNSAVKKKLDEIKELIRSGYGTVR